MFFIFLLTFNPASRDRGRTAEPRSDLEWLDSIPLGVFNIKGDLVLKNRYNSIKNTEHIDPSHHLLSGQISPVYDTLGVEVLEGEDNLRYVEYGHAFFKVAVHAQQGLQVATNHVLHDLAKKNWIICKYVWKVDTVATTKTLCTCVHCARVRYINNKMMTIFLCAHTFIFSLPPPPLECHNSCFPGT